MGIEKYWKYTQKKSESPLWSMQWEALHDKGEDLLKTKSKWQNPYIMKLWGLSYHKLLTDNDSEEENMEARRKEVRSLQKKVMSLVFEGLITGLQKDC